MSRIGKKPVPVPKGVTVDAQRAAPSRSRGPRASCAARFHPEMQLALDGRPRSPSRGPATRPRHKALHGLTRTLVANMVEGVTKGYSKTLEIQGVGYKAEAKPYGVQLVVGLLAPGASTRRPKGIKIAVENNTVVKIEGADKELVGQVAAELRSVRPPEPYKGKGIRYQGEQVRRKAGKTGAK